MPFDKLRTGLSAEGCWVQRTLTDSSFGGRSPAYGGRSPQHDNPNPHWHFHTNDGIEPDA